MMLEHFHYSHIKGFILKPKDIENPSPLFTSFVGLRNLFNLYNKTYFRPNSKCKFIYL